MNHKALMNIGEFAKRSGLTVRTIRYYDIKGLLKPMDYSESGYRMYCEKDFGRLEQILALKFIGFSLEEIKRLLKKRDVAFKEILAMQKKAVQEKIRHMKTMLNAIESAENTISDGEVNDWDSIIYIIKVVRMENTKDWAEQFYSDEQLNNLKNRNYTPEQAQADAKRWDDLLQEIRDNINMPPDSPEVQQLAGRYLALINEFTQGDGGMQNSLNNLWSNVNSAPQEMKDYYARNQDVFAFVQKALAARKS